MRNNGKSVHTSSLQVSPRGKHSLGNCRIVWTDGNVQVFEKDKEVIEADTESSSDKKDLPF